jgi:glutamate dehydrogenase/leucine dehydrogenase
MHTQELVAPATVPAAVPSAPDHANEACSLRDLHDGLAAERVRRAYVVFQGGRFQTSHPWLLDPLRDLLAGSYAFAGHEGVFVGREPGIATLFFVFVHATDRGCAQGGLRLKRYDDGLVALLEDGLKLAQGMTRKNALAGIWWGGGKAVIPVTPEIDQPAVWQEGSAERRRLLEAFGRFVADLGGLYTTAEDVGTNTWDMDVLLGVNRFTTCVSPARGGSGNPSPQTARGVLRGIEAAWEFLAGSASLVNVRVALQGAGHVGAPLAELLCGAGARVWVSENDDEESGRLALRSLKARLPQVTAVGTNEIWDVEADVFVPCALGGVINEHTIPKLKVRLVCGAANNILEQPEADAWRLFRRGIAFVPDFVVNRMGIVNCAGEVDGPLEDDVDNAVARVFPETLEILEEAKGRGTTALDVANQRADLLARERHPLHPMRARRILDRLLVRWANEFTRPEPAAQG